MSNEIILNNKEELKQKKDELIEKLAEYKMQLAAKSFEKVHLIRKTRREIANLTRLLASA